MTKTIPEVIEEMRFHAEENIKTDKRNNVNGILTTEGRILQGYAQELQELWNDKKNLIISELHKFRDKEICDHNPGPCEDCKNRKECFAIRNVMRYIESGVFLSEDEM